MKEPNLIVFFLLCLIITFVIGRSTAPEPAPTVPQYEFHVGSGAANGVVWRMNKQTGEVELSYGARGWHSVPDEKFSDEDIQKMFKAVKNSTNSP